MIIAMEFIDRVKNTTVTSGYDGNVGNGKEVRYFALAFSSFNVSLCRFVGMENGERLLCV